MECVCLCILLGGRGEVAKPVCVMVRWCARFPVLGGFPFRVILRWGVWGCLEGVRGVFLCVPLVVCISMQSGCISFIVFRQGAHHAMGWSVVVWAWVWFHIAILCGIWDPLGVLWVGDIRGGVWSHIVARIRWVVSWYQVGDVVLQE